MQKRKPAFARICVLFGLALVGLACTVELTSPPPESTEITVPTNPPANTPDVVNTALPSTTPTETATVTVTPTETLTPTPEPTATPTQSPVTMTAGQKLSCVTGPQWILYEWVTSIAKGETVSLLARNTYEKDEYYYIRKADGTECWAFGESSTINGDPSLLPLKEAPSLPKVKFSIENKTGIAACDVFIRPKNDTVWGADRLGTGNIAIDAVFTVEITAGFYDVQIKDCGGGVLYEKEDRPIGTDAGYRILQLATDVKIYIQNNQGVDLCLFRFQMVGGDWKDLHTAADGAVPNGQRVNFTLRVGRYNMSFHRCSDGVSVGTKTNVYVGSITPGFNTP